MLQVVAGCCRVLKGVAVCRNASRCVAEREGRAHACMMRTACCKVLQVVAGRRRVLQCAAGRGSVLQSERGGLMPVECANCIAVCCSVLQCVAVCCSVLQCVAVCVCGSVL